MGGSLWLRGVAGSLAVGKTLVTGATGLVGSHVARALVARGDDVRVTVREHAMLDAIADLDVEVVTADVLQRRDMRRALRGVDRAVHVAGGPPPRARRRDPFHAHLTGARGAPGGGVRAGAGRAGDTPPGAAPRPAPPR